MKAPEPQGYLTEEAKEIYYEIIKLLEGVNALEEQDSYGLSMMADCLYQYRVAADYVNEHGPVTTFNTGHTQVSAYFTVKKDALATFLKYSEKFGLSPKDRQLITKFKSKKKETDALDEL